MIEVGNIKHTPKEYVLWVYDSKAIKPKASIAMPDDMVVSNEVMGEHYIQFSFDYPTREFFKRADYINYNGIKYRLREDCKPKEVNTQLYKYELKFEASEMFFLDCVMFYTMQGYKEVEWVLYGKAQQFLEIAADNISNYLNEEWTVGIIEPTDLQNITFNSQNVFDGLTDIAEAFKAEWYVDYELKTINLVYQRESSDIVTLRREVSLIDIQKANESEEDYCTRLFAFGSTRNIPKNYRQISDDEVIDAIVQKKLRLPAEVGDYVDAFPGMNRLDIIERVKIFEDIYPKRIGNVTSLRQVEKTDENGDPFIIYYIKDAGLQFKSEYILANETLMLQFGNNSWLAGRDFELSYSDKTDEFEIIVITEGDNYIPNEILKPKIGDEYVLYGFDISLVGDQYIPEAEKELEDAAREYLKTIATDTATYTCIVNPVFRLENDLDLQIGQRVRMVSMIFESGEKLSRVYGYRKYPITAKDEYVVGNVMDYKRLARIENSIEGNKKEADVQYLEAMKAVNGNLKNIKALNYLRIALENETMIDKGLLLTTLIRLGAVVGDEWKEVAGINGAAIEPDDVVAYFGGPLDDAAEGKTPIGFKVDGSGWLANQNIIWDALGNLLLSGKFESNKNGNRIEIDPEDRSLKFINSIGQTLIHMYFEEDEGDDGEKFFLPRILLNHFGWKTGDEPAYVLDITGYEIRFLDNSTGYMSYLNPENVGFFNREDQSQPSFSASRYYIPNDNGEGSYNLEVSMNGLPSSDPNQSGRLFRNGKALNIS
ncbi:hypothetical protein D0T84_01160 [Dysgonomonas sp. 521]|uniref:hypothetical protein n=1 Tax=Dysgonomonas sp. 521 TaxID=2302932 RepID=UPI0013D713A8|nr:hypothetical protein [Dysgonomonas sp. 521]NDV93525.1 hypothetical protein [Dysgonomonas sp. 521]